MARLDELERKFEENPRRYFAPLANEYRKAGDAAKAAELCRSQLPDVPGHISGHIVLGQALFDSGDFAGARAALETALALDPENIVALRYLGDIARDTGDRTEAERWYSRTLEADPYNEAATQGLQAVRDRESATTTSEAPAESAEPEAAAETAAPAAVAEGFEPTAHAVEPAAGEGDELTAETLAEPEPTIAEPEPAPVEEEPVEDVRVSAEFAGDLAISAASEATEEGTDETQAESAEGLPAEATVADAEVAPVVADETTPPQAAPVERFDVAAHESPEADAAMDALEAAPGDEAMQAEERVMESAAPFVTETMAELYLEQGYPHEALELLLQLLEQRPEDERLREKVAHIESVIAARRDAAVAAARADRAERAETAPAADAPFDAGAAEVDSSAFADNQDAEAAEEEAPTTVREMFARMDRARPRPPSTVTPRPLSRLRSDFVPMPDSGAALGESADDPFAFPDAPRPEPRVARTSGPQPTFNPSTADIEDFEAWLRGLKGP